MSEIEDLRLEAQKQVYATERFHRSENADVCAAIVTLRTNLRWMQPLIEKDITVTLPYREIVKCVEQIEDVLAQSQCTIRDRSSESLEQIAALHEAYVDLLHEHHVASQSRQASTQHAINDPAVRAAVYQLTGGRCAYCDCQLEEGTGSTEAFTVEHVVPRESGGPDNLANYVPACKSCNCSKGTGHVLTFIKRRVGMAVGVRPELRVVNDAG